MLSKYCLKIATLTLLNPTKSHPPDAIVRSVRLDVHDPWAVLANSAGTRWTLMQLFHPLIAFCLNKDLFPSFSLPKAAESLSFSFQFFCFLRVSFWGYSESDWCGWILRSCLNCMQNTCTINTLQCEPMDQKQKLSGRSSNNLRASNQAFFLASSSFVRRRLSFQVQYVRRINKRLEVSMSFSWANYGCFTQRHCHGVYSSMAGGWGGVAGGSKKRGSNFWASLDFIKRLTKFAKKHILQTLYSTFLSNNFLQMLFHLFPN